MRADQRAWTEDEDRVLREGYGARSASVLGNELGKSRSAIMGRAFRLGLCATGQPGGTHPAITMDKRPRTPKPKPERTFYMPKLNPALTPKQPPKPLPRDCWKPLHGCTPVHIYELEAQHCRWPVGPMLFCGCDQAVGSPYCATHTVVAQRGQAAVLSDLAAAARHQPLATAR